MHAALALRLGGGEGVGLAESGISASMLLTLPAVVHFRLANIVDGNSSSIVNRGRKIGRDGARLGLATVVGEVILFHDAVRGSKGAPLGHGLR